MAPLRTTNAPSNSRSITYHKNNVQSPLEHTQSLHYMNIRQFFTCLNCIPSTKFASTRARVLFTIYDSFPRESSQCVINFGFSTECHAMEKTSLWSWNKKWVICILSRSSEHLWWQREIFYARHPQLEALLLSYRELNFRGIKSNTPT